MSTWRCQRQRKGVKCRHINAGVKRKCEACGGPRPVRKLPGHLAVLSTMPYEEWLVLFGQRCGICGRVPSARRRLDRDHDHKSGRARGLLCARCNRALPGWVTPQWLRAAADYLERSA